MSESIQISVLFGHRRLVQVREVRDGKLYLGGYSIGYDRNGVETDRTEVTWNGCLYCEGAAVDLNGQIVRRPWWQFWKSTTLTPDGRATSAKQP